jgi:hypothetical protein
VPDPNSKVGYYYPLKENTRRFEIVRERANRAKAEASKARSTKPAPTVQTGTGATAEADIAPYVPKGRSNNGY